MADKTTFIKIDRNIVNWGWFKSTKVLHVFLWLLIKANIKPGHFEKDTISRGSVATSNAHIADGCGLTINNVRTALANLEATGEITRIARNHYQIITIVNYETYQTDVLKTGYPITSNIDGKSQSTSMANHNNQRKKEGKKSRCAPIPLRGFLPVVRMSFGGLAIWFSSRMKVRWMTFH